jgi:hypothetical protein
VSRTRWVTIAAGGAILATIPVVAWAAQDAPLSSISVATFYGPISCGPPQPVPKRHRAPPSCTYRPVDATLLVVDLKDGRTVGRTRTHADGRGGVIVRAGQYEIRPVKLHGVVATPPFPKRVTVEAGGNADVILDYDPGDR